MSSCISVGRLAKGTRDWPLEVGFKGNMDRQTFYICLREDSIDAGKFLEDIADGTAGEFFQGCRLDSAGLFFSHSSQEGQSASDPDPVTKEGDLYDALIRLLQEKREYMEKGVCLWMEADIRNLSLFSGLLKIGYHGEEKLVILGSLDKKADTWDQFYYASLPEIELLHAVVFRHVRLGYQVVDKKSRFALAGEVELSVEGFQLSFRGELFIGEEGYRAQMEAMEGKEAPVFAVGSEGLLQMDDLVFHLECVYGTEGRADEKKCRLETEVWFVGQKWKGGFYYISGEGGTCWQLELALETDLSLAGMLRQLFGGGTVGSALFDLEILRESALLCSMSNGGTDRGGAGEFRLRLHTVLTFMVSIELYGEVKISPDTFSFSLRAGDALDLGVLRISGVQGETGPAFSYQHRKNVPEQENCMMIEGDIAFFGERLLEGRLWYSGGKKDWCLRAELSPEGILKTVFGDRLTVVYDKKTGFRLENMDAVNYADDAFDFLERMKTYLDRLGKANGCKEISAAMDRDELQTRWEIRPGFEGMPDREEKGVKITLQGSFCVMDRSGKTLLERHVGVDTPLEIAVSSQMTAKELWEGICGLLRGTADQMVEALFDEGNFRELEAVLTVLAKDKLEDFVAGLLCRKLVSEKTAVRLLPEEPSGGGGDQGGGESGEGGSAGEGFSIFASGGGTAFSSGEIGEWIGAGFGGLAVISVIASGGGGGAGPDEPLPCPEFRGQIDGATLRIELQQVDGAVGYELDIMWTDPAREDRFFSWKVWGKPPQISFVKIPVNGKIYLAARALHEREERNSPWSEGNYLGEIDYRQLISWGAKNGMCIRECLQMLREHQVDTKDTKVMELLLAEYFHPANREQVVREHYSNNDSAQVCLEHLERAFPHLFSGEIMLCMWREGYEEDDILRALSKLRPALSQEDTKEQFLEMIREEAKDMELRERFNKLAEQKAGGQLTEIAWRRALAELCAAYDPVEVASFLKDQGNSAEEIAFLLQDIFGDHRAVTIGGIILNERIYPDTTREEMEGILRKVFPKEDIEKALGILYPAAVIVSAREVWLDTGIQVAEDEIVNVRYLSGLWNVNPSARFRSYGPEGIGITAKEGYALPGENEGCLVGKIGSGKAFYIGTGAALPKESGTLFLTANDDLYGRYGSGYKDNEGAVTVEIRKELR